MEAQLLDRSETWGISRKDFLVRGSCFLEGRFLGWKIRLGVGKGGVGTELGSWEFGIADEHSLGETKRAGDEVWMDVIQITIISELLPWPL